VAEAHAVEGYDPAAFEPFAVTVDIVVFTLRHDRLQLVLIERGEPPFAGAWALPGGFVLPNENLLDAAGRELIEETATTISGLRQLGAYGAPDRDPRMRVVTVAWWAILPALADPVAGTDAAVASLVDVDDVIDGRIEVAFDHHQIITDALAALRHELQHSTLAASFWDGEFCIADLRRVYETVFGTRLEPGNFQRRVRKIDGFIEPTGRRRLGRGRPAELFVAAGDGPAPLDPPLQIPHRVDEGRP
jgi:8-oxo-dGTP diphosphatase